MAHSPSPSLTLSSFQSLLAKARANSAAAKEKEEEAALASIQEVVATHQPTHVDLSNIGITPDTVKTKEGIEKAIEQITEVASAADNSILQSQKRDTTYLSGGKKPDAGVTRDVTLNEKQQLFVTTALAGDDVCLIGAAGTGKTTVVGKFMIKLIELGILKPLRFSTKWLREDVPGAVVVSFTRKAVNNIRRAVPDVLKPHTITIHKLLEFAPVFYEVQDEKNPLQIKKTMRFEPQRHSLNPLPSTLSLVVHEESSMEGVDLYNMLSAALPHNPQEIFIGDIRQLPPIFGPAILGFKMSLLPVVELDEVYRQALLSPIIRLAHAVLSGDSTKFSTAGMYKEKEPHPHLKDEKTGKHVIVERLHVPKLEAFNCSDEHGTVKIQIWQKKLTETMAMGATMLQFQAWEKNGYFKPDEDIILCPFNKGYGTIELNKGIQNYLGLKRGAVVHEVIAGFNKHYLAVGDRVLYDKEDAFIVDIKRNATYMGSSYQPASPHLDRWGKMEVPLSKEEQEAAELEDAEFSAAAIDKFMDTFSSDDDEDRVNVASHAITIRFSFSEEEVILTKAGEVNNLLGGNAITVHKMQGSENERIFFLLHHTHAVMVQNELLYTGITRARSFLHIICETDTFFKGVKSHKVRGVTLQNKIEFFKGKGEFKEMQAEMEMLKKQREYKKQQAAKLRQLEDLEKLDTLEYQIIPPTLSGPIYEACAGLSDNEHNDYPDFTEGDYDVGVDAMEVARRPQPLILNATTKQLEPPAPKVEMVKGGSPSLSLSERLALLKKKYK